jgi:hypothetical protein
MLLVIRHYPDKKRPCICLEEGNKGVIIGYLTNEERENWLKQAFNCGENQTIGITTPNTIFDAEREGEK